MASQTDLLKAQIQQEAAVNNARTLMTVRMLHSLRLTSIPLVFCKLTSANPDYLQELL